MRRSAALIAAVVGTGLSLGTGPRAEVAPPIRIGATPSQTGAYAPLGQAFLRGYQLCLTTVGLISADELFGRRPRPPSS